MGNELYHNKWHGFNHFTVPVTGFPDSGTDPIASESHPFRGTFFNSISGSFGLKLDTLLITESGKGYTKDTTIHIEPVIPAGGFIIEQPIVSLGIDSENKGLSSIEVVKPGRYFPPIILVLTPSPGDVITRTAKISISASRYLLNSNSLDWWFYSNLTSTNSSNWNMYPSVYSSNNSLSANWQNAYNGYTNMINNSGKWMTVFSQVCSVSASELYDFNGIGWHVALSSTNHRTNRPLQVDINQKVATPASLVENSDRTIWWYTSAQTVFYSLTGNYPLTATNIIGAKKGGKYTMWLFIDYCPESRMQFFFDKRFYNIALKKYDNLLKKDIYTFEATDVLMLSANSITRIDFTYDGQKMLGRATYYRTSLETTDDLYFQGTGIRFKDPDPARDITRNPVYINSIYEGEGKHFEFNDNTIGEDDLNNPRNSTGIFIVPEFKNTPPANPITSFFDANSTLYVPGSGIFFRYLGANQQYFNFVTFGAQFPTEPILSKYISLTSSFDRVIASLSAGDWLQPAFAGNLVCTPDKSILTNTISAAFPQPPYEFNSSNIVSLKQCTSTFTLEVYSGKDRDIDSIIVNGTSVPIVPNVVDGMSQPYNFNNERTARLIFYRIQKDFDIEVYYTNQPPVTIPSILFNISSLNQFTINLSNVNKITYWGSNTENDSLGMIQNNASIAPVLSTFKAIRYANFNTNRTMTSNIQLTALSGFNGVNSNFFKGFSTFTVLRVRSFPLRSFVWWIGDYTDTTEQKGYGLVLSGSSSNGLSGRIYTVSRYEELGRNISSGSDVNNVIAGDYIVVSTVYNPNKDTRKQNVFINGKISVTQRSFSFAQFNNPQTNYNLVFGKNPNTNNNFGSFDLFDFYLFERALNNDEVIKMNKFLFEKINSYKLI